MRVTLEAAALENDVFWTGTWGKSIEIDLGVVLAAGIFLIPVVVL